MKRRNLVLVFMLVMLLTTVAWAQMPEVLNYQAKLTNSAGEPLTGDHSFDFAILDNENTILWQTTESVVISVEDGIYSVILGGDGMLPLDAWGINPFSAAHLTWLQVTVDGEQLSPNQQILPVAYAHRANSAFCADYAINTSMANYNFLVDGYIEATQNGYGIDNSDIRTTYGTLRGSDVVANRPYSQDYGGNIYASHDLSVEGVKNFVIDHPLQKEKKIVYACIEGPEAAVYTRGTAELINGEAWVPFEEHFELVVNPETISVQLTSLSAESEGLAVIEKKPNGFRVKELRKGTGSYKFDYFVQGIRKGYEEYRVIRDKSEYEFKNNSKN